MAKIYAPNEEYTGVSAGVYFVKGIGETEDDYLIEWFKEKGYKVEEKGQKEEQEEKSEGKPKTANKKQV